MVHHRRHEALEMAKHLIFDLDIEWSEEDKSKFLKAFEQAWNSTYKPPEPPLQQVHFAPGFLAELKNVYHHYKNRHLLKNRD
jgi:hypothetical protein